MINIDLSGRVAVVTGGAGELGRVMVRTLAEAGADVAIHYFSSDKKAMALLEEVRAKGRRGCVVRADVSSEKDVMSMRDTVRRELGDADIIVNNAVIQIHPWKGIFQTPLEDYESQFRSCVMHNVLMARAFVPAMIEKKWGRVIALSAEAAVKNDETQSAYSAGKRGQDGVLRVLAREIGKHNITVNQVAPGWTMSEKLRATNFTAPHYVKTVPMGRHGTDQEIANVIAFLASDLASFVNGAFIPVSGGTVMPAI